MIFVVRERESSNPESITQPYWVHETEDEVVLDRVDAIDAAIIQWRIDYSIDPLIVPKGYSYERLGKRLARITINDDYVQYPVGATEVGFQFQAQSKFVRWANNWITVKGFPSDTVPLPKHFGYRLMANFSLDNARDVPVEGEHGINISPPPAKYWMRYVVSDATVTDSYVNTIGQICGTVNNTIFRGYAAETLMLVSASGSRRDKEAWNFYFGFGFEPIVVGRLIGEIEMPNHSAYSHVQEFTQKAIAGLNLSGFEYDWVFHETRAAYIAQVWPYTDFALLGLP